MKSERVWRKEKREKKRRRGLKKGEEEKGAKCEKGGDDRLCVNA